MIAALIQRFLTPALGLALAGALLLAGWQWREATAARAEVATAQAKVEQGAREFAEYRETQERQAREALQAMAADKARSDKARQEALDAEFLARLAAQADADRLRAGSGQLQRYAQDLAASLGRAARDPAAAGNCPAIQPALDLFADVLGRLDEAAAGVVQHADNARIAGQLCQSSYEALTP